MRKTVLTLSGALVLSSLLLWGCSSSPSKDERNQLKTTQDEISSLAQKSNDLKKEKTSLQMAIQAKEAKLKGCQDDKTAVELKLKGSN